MDRTCPKCGAVKSGATWKMDEACPSCGAIFAKAVAAANAPAPAVSRRKESPWAIAVLVVAGPYALYQIGSAMLIKVPRAEPDLPTFSRSDAIVSCKEAIERQARYQSRWEGGWTTQEFHELGSAAPGSKYIRYGGNQLSMQNGFGAWERMAYVCTWDPDSQSVVQADVFSASGG